MGCDKRKIELLSPVRDLESGRAAVDFGADALYVGGNSFGARAAAANSTEDIARLTHYAHGFGVRVYAALNTLIYPDEVAKAQSVARELIDAGVDALIIQDMAFLQMGLDGVEFHASTQMQNSSAERVKFLQDCGFSRVILERGLTLDQIRAIRAVTDVELEAFVHGAICVGYSGRCYLSRSMSTRSGNRGDCAQPCRLPYDLMDGSGNFVMRGKHLLSLGDLNLSAQIPALISSGVTSFKIEGRLKDTTYVKNVVAYYRAVIDSAMDATMHRTSSGRSVYDFVADPNKSFTRGATTYYINGKTSGVASFDTAKAVGTFIGRVTRTDSESFTINASTPLSPADGICFVTMTAEQGGTNINRVEGERVFPNSMDYIKPGTSIFRNFDHRFIKAVRGSKTRRLMEVRAFAKLCDNGMTLRLEDVDGNRVSTELCAKLDQARDVAVMVKNIETQIGRSGDMPFEVTDVIVETSENAAFIPLSQINALRREAMEMLLDVRRSKLAEHRVSRKDASAMFAKEQSSGYDNITNPLSEQFYRDHGVKDIAAGYDLEPTLKGVELMRTPYCIRREIGECLLLKHDLQESLTLVHGAQSYRLGFDCGKCEMTLMLT